MSAVIGKIIQTKGRITRLIQEPLFRKKCQNPIETQWKFLHHLLQTHRDTDFGKKYDFQNISSIPNYQKAVPIHSWAEMRPYIEEVKKGRHTVLFPESDPILMFATTSGTTDECKHIPVTKESYKRWNNTWDLTWANVLREAPRGFYGKALYFPGDPQEGFIGHIPHGAITAKAYEAQSAIIRTVYPYPYQISRIKDYQLRYYTIMRIALEVPVSFIPIANSSTSLTLFQMAQDRRQDLIDDIRFGRLRRTEDMPQELVRILKKQIRPNPKRAEELEAIYQETGDFLPRDYWKHSLSFVIAFSSGPSKLYLKRLRKYVGEHIPIFDFGLLASEARFSFPISAHQEECCLAIESNFFEFILEDKIQESQPQTLTLDQVEVGKRYYILTTNASGLYRYNISDVVEITGFYERVPLISFCHKGKHVASITGEKITEYQVTESVKRALEKTEYSVEGFVVCLHWDEQLPHYSFLKGPSPKDSPEVLQKLINLIEEELLQLNKEYSSKRASQRLGPLTLKVVQGEVFEEYQNKRKQACHNLSQYKYVYLISDPQFEEQFEFQSEYPASVLVS